MHIYSQNIIRFIAEIKKILHDVLSCEIGLKVHGSRFYSRDQRSSYPIKIVIYNNKSHLGHFDPFFYEMGFHENLKHLKPEKLRNIIRHELAHYITYINYGESVQPHGNEFKAFCEQMGWKEDVSRAAINLENEAIHLKLEDHNILRKVQKLMALATSNNANEAELAMIKTQQLLLKHNIDTRYIELEGEEKMYLKRIFKEKKENAKMRAIANILETFFVNTVYHRQGGFTFLEIVGSAMNIEIAEYVANFLYKEMDVLWKYTKKEHAQMKGRIAKNSFFLGISIGYCNKIHALKKNYTSNESHALMIIEKKLMEAKSIIYPQLSSTKSKAYFCQTSSALGQQAGKSLSIHPALGSNAKGPDATLIYIA